MHSSVQYSRFRGAGVHSLGKNKRKKRKVIVLLARALHESVSQQAFSSLRPFVRGVCGEVKVNFQRFVNKNSQLKFPFYI